ncbi:phage holin family protein [Neobacillus niacini]|uniref:phage holin family protein n=1 Tax=Neobacillus niacini TaxID=86668 RepID=UPI002FFEEBEE
MDLNLNSYIRPDAFILVPVLYIISLNLRQTPFIPLWTHAWIQMLFAVIACLLYYGLEIQSVVQGILVTGAALISRNIISSTINGLNESKNKKESTREIKDKEEDRNSKK